MALSVGELEATLKLKSSLDADLAKANQQLGGFSSSIKQIGGIIAAAFTVQKVIEFGVAAVKSYSEQEDALVRLSAALRSQGTYTPALAAQYEALSAKFQQTTIYADELTVEMMSLLTQVGNVMPAEMEGALTAATNLASGLGIDLRAATMLVGKAFAGETGTLKKYGIVIDEASLKSGGATAVLKALNDQFGGQSQAQASTYSGQVAQLTNTWDDFKESVGKVLVDVLQPMIPAFKEAVTWMQGVGKVVEFMRTMFDALLYAGLKTIKWLVDAQITVLSLTNAFGVNSEAIAKLREQSEYYGGAIEGVVKGQTAVGVATETTTGHIRENIIVDKEATDAAKKHADALAAVDLKILEATRDTGHLTSTQEASIIAYNELGLSAEEMALKLNVSTLAVGRFIAEQERAASAIASYWGEVGTILDRVFGVESVAKATQWKDAIDALGGSVAQLSNDDLVELEEAMSDGIDALVRSGQATSEQTSAFAALQIQAQKVREATLDVGDALRDEARWLGMSADAAESSAVRKLAASAAVTMGHYAEVDAAMMALAAASGGTISVSGQRPPRLENGRWVTDSGPLVGASSGFTLSGGGLHPLTTRDSGGPVSAGQPYLVGRGAQPELFVPSSAGTMYPAGRGNTTLNIYVTQPLGTPDAIGKAVMQSLRAQGVRLPIGA